MRTGGHGEPLGGRRMAVLEAREPDLAHRDRVPLGENSGREGGGAAGLAYQEPVVRAGPLGLESKLLVHPKIVRLAPQHPGHRRRSEGTREVGKRDEATESARGLHDRPPRGGFHSLPGSPGACRIGGGLPSAVQVPHRSEGPLLRAGVPNGMTVLPEAGFAARDGRNPARPFPRTTAPPPDRASRPAAVGGTSLAVPAGRGERLRERGAPRSAPPRGRRSPPPGR